MNVQLRYALELSPELLARWREILHASPDLASPFFRPEFVQIAARVRPRVQVAVLRKAGQVVGFFPFERTAWNIARPVGGSMSDYQAVIAGPDAAWNPEELLAGCRLSAWEFDHQLARQTQLAEHFASRAASPIIDLTAGYAAWLEDRKQATQSFKELLRKRRKLEREIPDLVFTWHSADRVRFELIDYRDLAAREAGHFDRIVSVGMFEHVGAANFDTFFRAVANLMTADGVMLLHTIGRFGKPGSTDAFTRKYIFPGGYIPALSETLAASEKSRLIVADVETLRLHYALTLRQWYARTLEHEAEIVAMMGVRFFRMWCFYLAGATAAFESGGMGNYQIQFARSRHALPLTRDYIAEAERRYAG